MYLHFQIGLPAAEEYLGEGIDILIDFLFPGVDHVDLRPWDVNSFAPINIQSLFSNIIAIGLCQISQ